MTRTDAQIRAMQCWSTADGSRRGHAWLRCSAGPNREVGYTSRSGKRGGWSDTVLGCGTTWEEAFADADSKERKP